jgi:hypothetical protein
LSVTVMVGEPTLATLMDAVAVELSPSLSVSV